MLCSAVRTRTCSFGRLPLPSLGTAALVLRALAFVPTAVVSAAQPPPPLATTSLLHSFQTFASLDDMPPPRRSPPLVFPAPGKHTATVIFGHGLGDTGHGWASAVENWRRRERLDEIKFILPHAPTIPITVNMGMQMPGWFDIKAFDGPQETLRRLEDEPGLLQSRDYFHQLVQAEIDEGIPSDRIILGGFSQGGAMALLAGLTAPMKLAGIVGMSCWLPLSAKVNDLVPEGKPNQATKVLMAHGGEDTLVKTIRGIQSSELLKEMGIDVTFKLYDGMAHSACLEELDDVQAFLEQQLPPLEKK